MRHLQFGLRLCRSSTLGYNIVVCAKQVPDTKRITGEAMKEDGTVNRAALPAIFNPEDLNALEAALAIRDEHGGTVTVITMGPPAACELLRDCLCRGADKVVLISDRRAAASDTLATSYILSCAIKKIQPDIVLCGRQAIDGDTAQTGPSIAQHLNWPQVTYVKDILGYKDGTLTVKREVEDGIETINIKLPAVLCMLKCDYEPRRPLIEGFIKAHKAEVKSYSMEDIKLAAEEVGMKGSPTYVSKAFRPEQKQGGEVITPKSAKEGAEILKEKLKEFEIIK